MMGAITYIAIAYVDNALVNRICLPLAFGRPDLPRFCWPLTLWPSLLFAHRLCLQLTFTSI